MTSWLLVNGLLINSGYTAFANDLNTLNVGTYSAWTTDYVKAATPVKSWFTTSYAMMIMHGSDWFIWFLNNSFGNDGGLLHKIFMWEA